MNFICLPCLCITCECYVCVQVAGQVVATWGPRPGTRGHNQHIHVPTDYQASAGFGSPLNDYHHHHHHPQNYHQHHQQHRPPRKYYQDRKHGYNQSRQVMYDMLTQICSYRCLFQSTVFMICVVANCTEMDWCVNFP